MLTTTNGVSSENLENHVNYNTIMRFGQALFVNRELVHEGYLVNPDTLLKAKNIISKIPKKREDEAPYM